MKKLIVILFILCSSQFVYSQSGWFPLNSGVTNELKCILFTDSLTGYAAGNGIILKTTNAGLNWFVQFSGPISDYAFWALFFTSHDTGYAGCDGLYIFKTTNGGSNWFIQSSNMGRVWTIFFVDQNTGYTGGKYGSQRKTTDGGNNWINITNGGGSNYTSFYFQNANTGFAATEGEGILRTTNGALFWDTVYRAPYVICYSLFFTSTATGYAGARNPNQSIILKTTNSGLNWSPQLLIYGGDVKSIFFPDQYTGYAACMAYLYKTTNSGATWINQYISSYIYFNSVYFTSSNTGYSCGNNGVIMKTTTGGEPIGIKPISNSIPSKYILSQNYPNPFNPTTKIKFQIPLNKGGGFSRGLFTRLTIYDLLGCELATLVNELVKPGTYEVDFDGTNYPSGIYFYKLTTGDFSSSKKMVLVK